MTEKVYLENPYLRKIGARIIEKKYRNNKYYIKTNKTIFYPNLSGGQPGDKGTINGVEVLDTYEDGEDIIHITKDNIHSDRAMLSIDWENRFDYMQQHSGQHLLSSVFYKLYNGETIGFHIGGKYVYIDINIPQINKDEIKKVEKFANKIIFSNFNIKSYIVKKEEIDKIPVRNEPTITSNIRIIEIDEIDFSPCCGTHVRNTGEIGIIKIRKVESYKNNMRVEFVCGSRALKDYSWKSDYIEDISYLLSSKDTDAKDKVKKLYNQKIVLEKENKILKEKLYKYRSK
ncbi:alanyl-tRNA editing protein [Schnuerera sp. xch1]|uniref:alanyl-tRNA editing protein n=1 Tax=Schnuerera sp. xch1 TaxID=2874283 RepID=UPI001CBDFB03|nr:alanyl-tRNA editing protein [Schnuerera sp. xch1]MBZ2175753.1 alanyl-tRNA editing protein [Schnuerera sp. xch1]